MVNQRPIQTVDPRTEIPDAKMIGVDNVPRSSAQIDSTICGSLFVCHERGFPRAIYVNCRGVEPGTWGRVGLWRISDGALLAVGGPQPIYSGWNRWKLASLADMEAGEEFFLGFQHNAVAAIGCGQADRLRVFEDADDTDFGAELPDPINLQAAAEGKRKLSICCRYDPGPGG
jgi:hypothetical protein